MFLHFKDRHGADKWINSAQAVRLADATETDNKPLTTIYLTDGAAETVQEDPSEVAAAMNRGMITDHMGKLP